MEIDEYVAKMLDLVVERKLKLNNVNQTRCLNNEDDDRKCGEEVNYPTL